MNLTVAGLIARATSSACIRLVSSNPYVQGAAAAGMHVAWLNRSGGPFDPLDEPPAMIASTLAELPKLLERSSSQETRAALAEATSRRVSPRASGTAMPCAASMRRPARAVRRQIDNE